jgi:hypothetical protein
MVGSAPVDLAGARVVTDPHPPSELLGGEGEEAVAGSVPGLDVVGGAAERHKPLERRALGNLRKEGRSREADDSGARRWRGPEGEPTFCPALIVRSDFKKKAGWHCALPPGVRKEAPTLGEEEPWSPGLRRPGRKPGRLYASCVPHERDVAVSG